MIIDCGANHYATTNEGAGFRVRPFAIQQQACLAAQP